MIFLAHWGSHFLSCSCRCTYSFYSSLIYINLCITYLVLSGRILYLESNPCSIYMLLCCFFDDVLPFICISTWFLISILDQIPQSVTLDFLLSSKFLLNRFRQQTKFKRVRSLNKPMQGTTPIGDPAPSTNPLAYLSVCHSDPCVSIIRTRKKKLLQQQSRCYRTNVSVSSTDKHKLACLLVLPQKFNLGVGCQIEAAKNINGLLLILLYFLPKSEGSNNCIYKYVP